MSVLIEGMEIPKEGSWVTLRVFPDGQCVLHSWCGNDEIKFDFMEHLTAVPVPPHGRLIDADALMKRMWDETDCMISVPATFVRDAPTVIPAEERMDSDDN